MEFDASSRYTIILFLVFLAVVTKSVSGQVQETNTFNTNLRQIEDDEETTTATPVTPATVSPERYYENFNAALNITSGIFQDILCKVPLLRLCEGANGLKFPQYPVAPDTTTIPTTTTASTKVPAKVAVPNPLFSGLGQGHNVIIIAQQPQTQPEPEPEPERK